MLSQYQYELFRRQDGPLCRPTFFVRLRWTKLHDQSWNDSTLIFLALFPSPSSTVVTSLSHETAMRLAFVLTAVVGFGSMTFAATVPRALSTSAAVKEERGLLSSRKSASSSFNSWEGPVPGTNLRIQLRRHFTNAVAAVVVSQALQNGLRDMYLEPRFSEVDGMHSYDPYDNLKALLYVSRNGEITWDEAISIFQLLQQIVLHQAAAYAGGFFARIMRTQTLGPAYLEGYVAVRETAGGSNALLPRTPSSTAASPAPQAQDSGLTLRDETSCGHPTC